MSGHSGGGGAKRDYPVGRPGQPPGPSFPLLLAQALGREKAGGRWPGSPHSMLWAPVAHTPCSYPQPLASDQCPEPATAGSPAAALPPWGTRGSGQLPRLSLNPLPADQEAQSLPQARGMWLRTVQGRRPAPTGGGGLRLSPLPLLPAAEPPLSLFLPASRLEAAAPSRRETAGPWFGRTPGRGAGSVCELLGTSALSSSRVAVCPETQPCPTSPGQVGSALFLGTSPVLRGGGLPRLLQAQAVPEEARASPSPFRSSSAG